MTTDPVDPAAVWRAELDAAFARSASRAFLPRLLQELTREPNDDSFGLLGEQILSITRRELPRPLAEASALVAEALSAPLPTDLGAFAQRELRQRHGALALHAAHLFHWGLTREGILLRMDLDLFALPVEEERDAKTRFAVLLQGARATPRLAEFVPAAPAQARACVACRARGFTGDGECARCSGFGWL